MKWRFPWFRSRIGRPMGCVYAGPDMMKRMNKELTSQKKREKFIDELTSFCFSVNEAMSLEDSYSYRIAAESADAAILYLESPLYREGECGRVSLSQDEVSVLLQVINDLEINTWNGYKKVDKDVLDGGGFTLYIKGTHNGEPVVIKAHGCNCYPDEYTEFKSIIDNMFGEYRINFNNNRDIRGE